MQLPLRNVAEPQFPCLLNGATSSSNFTALLQKQDIVSQATNSTVGMDCIFMLLGIKNFM